MALRPIVTYPNPVLTTPTGEVGTVDEELRALVADMVETMHAERGVGLAANQVGVPLRLLVVDVSAGEDPEALMVLVNPRVVSSGGRQSGEEGCLSFPGIFEVVGRPGHVRIEASGLDGESLEIEADGFLARALLHEADHLDGKVFLDRMSPLKRKLVLRRIRRAREDGEWPETVIPEPIESPES